MLGVVIFLVELVHELVDAHTGDNSQHGAAGEFALHSHTVGHAQHFLSDVGLDLPVAGVIELFGVFPILFRKDRGTGHGFDVVAVQLHHTFQRPLVDGPVKGLDTLCRLDGIDHVIRPPAEALVIGILSVVDPGNGIGLLVPVIDHLIDPVDDLVGIVAAQQPDDGIKAGVLVGAGLVEPDLITVDELPFVELAEHPHHIILMGNQLQPAVQLDEGTHAALDRGIQLDTRPQLLQSQRTGKGVVSIDAGEILVSGLVNAKLPGLSGAAVPGHFDLPNVHVRREHGNKRGIIPVGAAVIDDGHLQIIQNGLTGNRGQSAQDRPLSLVGGDNDVDFVVARIFHNYPSLELIPIDIYITNTIVTIICIFRPSYGYLTKNPAKNRTICGCNCTFCNTTVRNKYVYPFRIIFVI